MAATTGSALDAALGELGWPELLAEAPEVAVPLVFRLLGETGAHAAVLNDVVRQYLSSSGNGAVASEDVVRQYDPRGESGTQAAASEDAARQAAGLTETGWAPLPFAGGTWVVWDRDGAPGAAVDEELPLRTVPSGDRLPDEALAAGRRALAWWLLGTGHTMLTLARQHVLERKQFGRPIASFQALRHRLAETFVALEGAEATLHHADTALGALLAKAATGQAALTAARHCQQCLGGIGFTAEHDLQRHIRRTLVLDGLLGSTRELTREAGAHIRTAGSAPRLAQL
ncbi:acyl-CoA dehydrogenase family protein [Nocardia sp. BMG51109]|uniref:acyl-CoA dehydrogenase family protein n=1 Tax=Nocardia sp. BMG51109 TaxID=1056816 RepID=UPI000A02BAB0|nr:acyl-CoA dehydrogenase family protein [Nocardia sp. BMG51109]